MKMILKILALPVLLVLKVLTLVGNLLTNLSSLFIGMFLLLLAGLAIYCIIQNQWLNLAILAGMAAATFVVLFIAVAGIFKIETWGQRLSDFIRS